MLPLLELAQLKSHRLELSLLELPLLAYFCFNFLFIIGCEMILKPVLFQGIFNFAYLPKDINFAVIFVEIFHF